MVAFPADHPRIELPRPIPRSRLVDRLRDSVSLVTFSRLSSAAGALLLIAVATWWLLRSPAPPVERRLPVASAASPTSTVVGAKPGQVTTGPTVTGPSTIMAQAAGAVVHPGVYALPATARVADLVAAAGGPTPDGDGQAVALAAKLIDGQRVVVPKIGDPAGATIGNDGLGAALAVGPIDLNAATPVQLDALPGVGPATAAAIVTFREQHGPFRSVEALSEVRGIGTAKLDSLRPLVRV